MADFTQLRRLHKAFQASQVKTDRLGEERNKEIKKLQHLGVAKATIANQMGLSRERVAQLQEPQKKRQKGV